MLTNSAAFTSLEYFRYVPVEGVTIEEVDQYLLQSPHELCCEVTNACNLNCRVCISGSPASGTVHLALKELISTLETLPDKIARITVTGGEPTLHPDLSEFVERCSRACEGMVLSTNGYDPSALRRVLKAAPVAVTAISLHGPKHVHDVFVRRNGAYERAVASIKIADSLTGAVHVFSTVTGYTVGSLSELSSELAKLPVSEHRFTLLKPNGRLECTYIPYETVLSSIKAIKVPHKVSVKRRDQPFIFLSCLGKQEVRHVQKY